MSDLTAVILAAGEGTRMRSSTPKVLHPLCGLPLVLWPVMAAREAGANRIVVVDGPGRRLEAALPGGVEIAVQAMQRGTGDAVRAAASHIEDDATVVVLMGDVPLITPHAIRALVDAHATGATMLTMVLDDPGSYGRVVRDAGGAVERVVEAKGGTGDATPEQLAIQEVNTGIFCFDGGALKTALDQVTPDNAQGEYYLPDVLPLMDASAHVTDDFSVTLGINDRVDLAAVRVHAQKRILEQHMLAGVTIVDPATTSIDAGVEIGQDTVIEPHTTLKAGTRIGSNCVIRNAFIDQATIEDGVSVGPFAYLRPGTHLRNGSKVGTFVEVKNSVVGAGSKIPHLSYIGDADIGEQCNLGAATITANYNNATKVKSRTTIGDRVKTSVDTTLVAPVTLHDDVSTGAGSVIVEDVPSGALGIARARQRNIEGYADRKEREKS